MKWFIAFIVLLLLISSSNNSKDKIVDGIGNSVQASSQYMSYDVQHQAVYDNNGNLLAVDVKTRPVLVNAIIQIGVVGILIFAAYKKLTK